jgi:hypothetical protein
MARYFRLEQAQRLLGELEAPLRELTDLKRELDELAAEWRAASERLEMLGGAVVDRGPALERRARRDALVSRLQEAIENVQEFGCTVKDLDMGLIDFPSRFRGEEVCLCWRLGEPEIAYWHGATEGFRGRKPIDREFREHHRGD